MVRDGEEHKSVAGTIHSSKISLGRKFCISSLGALLSSICTTLLQQFQRTTEVTYLWPRRLTENFLNTF